MKSQVKYLHQSHNNDCVPTCLYMALQAIGKDLPPYQEFLKSINPDWSVGTPLTDLYGVLDDYGVNFSVQWKANWEDLKRAVNKGIVFVSYWIPTDNESHCAIVKAISDRYIFLTDPWYGDNHRYLKKTFVRRWYQEDDDGWFLIIEKQ